MELLHELVARGSPEGACGLAFCLLDGPGELERDEPSAAKLFEQAARAGLAQAMCELGTMHFLGDGVPVNDTLALHWFRRAAEAGVSAGMYLYGECLLEGRGCEPDSAQAHAWFVRAGLKGHRGARGRIVEAVSGRDVELAQAYGRASGRKGSQWTAAPAAA